MATRTVPFLDGMKVGFGYDRLTGDRSTNAVVVGSASSVSGGHGQQVTFDVTTVQDTESLHKAVGISVDAGGSYMGFSASTKVDYVHSFDFSTFTIYVVVKSSVLDALDTLDDPNFGPDAVELLKAGNSQRFRARFADGFITGVKKGGEFFAVYQITGTNSGEQEDVANQVHAAYSSGLTSAELNTSVKTATQRSSSHLQVDVHIFRQGAIEKSQFAIEDIIEAARNFPLDVVGDNAFPYEVLVQDYAGLKNPNDDFSFIDIQAQQDSLADLATKRFEFLTLRDTLKYVLGHMDIFANEDGTPLQRSSVSAQFDEVIDAINTMERQAAACSQDPKQCSFTKFEAAKFSVPKLKVSAEDALIQTGKVIIDQDPLASILRGSLFNADTQRGFDIAYGVGGHQTLPGPGKDRIRNSLPSSEQGGFDLAESFFLIRNANLGFSQAGVVIANATPAVQAARAVSPDPFFTLGFDIASGLFGDPAFGGRGDTLDGPGKQKILASLNAAGKLGYLASQHLHLGPPPLPRRA